MSDWRIALGFDWLFIDMHAKAYALAILLLMVVVVVFDTTTVIAYALVLAAIIGAVGGIQAARKITGDM